MIVELHMLQNFAPSCLNRDDTNSPKECQFGGYRRARISSQCMKRAIREYFKHDECLVSLESVAKRTKLLHAELTKRLVDAGKLEEEAKKVVTEAVKTTNLKLKDSDKTEYLLFISEKEIDSFARVILNYWKELKSASDEKKLKTIGKELLDALNGGKAIDLALFGRMLADLPDKNIDAACQVAHAVSTHKVGVEFDFYTAVDDLQPEEEAGAGMMGTIEFNSACYYRYANIDINQLERNLLGKPWDKATADELKEAKALAQKSVEAFITAAVSAVPSGKQTSFAAQNPPDFIMAVVRDRGAWSLTNAFAMPVKEGGDLVENSIRELVGYWDRLNKAYGAHGIKAGLALTLKKVELDGLQEMTTFEELVSKVNQAIAAGC